MQQAAKILSPDFSGWILDEYLVKLEGRQKQENYVDPRHCLVFWARPPQHVRELIDLVQQKLRQAAPDIWLMPLPNLHMTAMEVTHSLTAPEIDHLVGILRDHCEMIANYPRDHRARLVMPMVSFDSAALALSFVPASGEAVSEGRATKDDEYTYHHFRKDLYDLITKSGVSIGSRYVVPSAHLTIARFNSPNVFGGDSADTSSTLGSKQREKWIDAIDSINRWLKDEYWPKKTGTTKTGGEWIVGQGKGLDFRKGRLWYGGGETVYLGKEF